MNTIVDAAPHDPRQFGDGDRTFLACGGSDGIRAIVDAFYDGMDSLEFAAHIRAMHPEDLTLARDKLHTFLCGWMGGPKLYAQKFGSMSIPRAHARFPIGVEEGEAWLGCFAHALDQLEAQQGLKAYLMSALQVPVDRIIAFQQKAQSDQPFNIVAK